MPVPTTKRPSKVKYLERAYQVNEMVAIRTDPAECSDCGWTGHAHQTAEIGHCALDPGDPSPVGRCPKCDCLAYLHRKKDKTITRAGEMLELLRQAVTYENKAFGEDEDISGADLVEWFAEWRELAITIIEEVDHV